MQVSTAESYTHDTRTRNLHKKRVQSISRQNVSASSYKFFSKRARNTAAFYSMQATWSKKQETGTINLPTFIASN